jgi:hypothetical protein
MTDEEYQDNRAEDAPANVCEGRREVKPEPINLLPITNIPHDYN